MLHGEKWPRPCTARLLALCLGIVAQANAATVFSDGFEAAGPAPEWSLTNVAPGRARIIGEYEPFAGAAHLVLDDSNNDAAFAAAHATLNPQLQNKKNVILSFKAKSLGNEPHPPPAGSYTISQYDAVAISVDGGATWRSVASLSALSTTWQSFVVGLDSTVAAAGGQYDANFRIRFSAYDNASAPVDGIAIDDVKLDADDHQQVLVELPLTAAEGAGGLTGLVSLALAQPGPVTVGLIAAPPGQLSLPASVVIPAGEAATVFTFAAQDDTLINLTRQVTVTPSLAGATVSSASITITDNEPRPSVGLELPATLREGDAATLAGAVTLSAPVTLDVVVTLTAAPPGQVVIPATVTMPAGQTRRTFSVQALDDTVLDGDRTVTMTAASIFAPVTRSVLAVDNEKPTAGLEFPAVLLEGGSMPGKVTLNAAVSRPVTVGLTSSSPTVSLVPASLVIPPGVRSADFTLTAAGDPDVNLSRFADITAGGTDVIQNTKLLTVQDDEPAPHLALSLPEEVTEGVVAGSNNCSLTLSGPVAVPVTMALQSVPAGDLTMPAAITIPAGTTSALFSLSPVNDNRVEGAVMAVVSASAPGLTTASGKIVIVDSEGRDLKLESTDIYVIEGKQKTITVSLPGVFAANLVVNLRASVPGIASFPSSVTVPAGSVSSGLTVTIPENALRDGTRQFELIASAPGLVDARLLLLIRDNEIAGYRFASLPDMVAGPAFSLTVVPVDVEGTPVSGANVQAALSVSGPDGVEQPLTPGTVTLAPQWQGSVTLPPQMKGPLTVHVRNNATGLHEASHLIYTSTELLINAQGFVWDGPRNRVLVSVGPMTGDPIANSLVAIDPETLESRIAVVSNAWPEFITLTDDGRYLYMSQRSNGTIAKVDLTTDTIVKTFPVTIDGRAGPHRTVDLCSVRSHPDTVIVCQTPDGSYAHELAVYDDGVRRPAVYKSATQWGRIIRPAAELDMFYYADYEETGLQKLRLTPDGLVLVASSKTGGEGGIVTAGGHLFTRRGTRLDPDTLKRTGDFLTGDKPILLLPGAGRFVHLADTSVDVRDLGTLRRVFRLNLGGLNSGYYEIIQCGEDMLATKTYDRIRFIRSSRLLGNAAAADLDIKVDESTLPQGGNQPATILVRLTNHGPNAATNVRLHLAFTGQRIDRVTGQGITFDPPVSANGGLYSRGRLTQLSAGQTQEIRIAYLPSASNIAGIIATCISDAAEPNLRNNEATRYFGVGFPIPVGALVRADLPTRGILRDETRGVLWAMVPETTYLPGPLVLSFNPASGAVATSLPVAGTAQLGLMEMSKNGRYLYAGLKSLSSIERIDLSAGTSRRLDLDAGEFSSGLADLEVLEGDGTALLISGGYQANVAVYDGDVPRPLRIMGRNIASFAKSPVAGEYIATSSGSPSTIGRLVVSNDGVVEGEFFDDRSINGQLYAAGDNFMSDSGVFGRFADLTRYATYPSGWPCVDARYGRTWFLRHSPGWAMTGYTTADAMPVGTLPLSLTENIQDVNRMERFGLDGFAIGTTNALNFVRWPEAIPVEMDQDADLISDRWESAHFGHLNADGSADPDADGIPNALEWLLTGSPSVAEGSRLLAEGSQWNGQPSLRLQFRRPAGLPPSAYRYETGDLQTWNAVAEFNETVLNVGAIDGIPVETVSVQLPLSGAETQFFRIAWRR